jgi:hypothetical protein
MSTPSLSPLSANPETQIARAYEKINTWMLQRLDIEINKEYADLPSLYLLKTIEQRQKTAFIGWLSSDQFPRVPQETKKKLIIIFDIYFLALLRLFYHANLGETSHRDLWNELLSTPNNPIHDPADLAQKNFSMPIPILYANAKSLILYPRPLGTRVRYAISDKIIKTAIEPLQRKIVKHPRISFSAFGLIFAIYPSIYSISLGLFTGLSLLFDSPEAHKEITKTLWDIGKNIALLALMGNLIFPLMLNGLINTHLPLPLPEFIIFAGTLLINFLLELKFAFNCYDFEKKNNYQIEGTQRELKIAVIKKTFAPITIPTLGSLAISVTLMIPKNFVLEGILNFSKILSLLECCYFMKKFATKKGTTKDAIQLALLGLNITPEFLKYFGYLTQKIDGTALCQEIQTISIFGVPTVSLPLPEKILSGDLCHELSGLTWKAQPETSPISRFFTAHSLGHGYELLQNQAQPINSSRSSLNAFALIPALPKPSPSHILENFCQLAAEERCIPPSSITHQIRGIFPPLPIFHSRESWMSEEEAFYQGFRTSLVTTSKNHALSQQSAVTLFLGIESYRRFRQKEHPPGPTNEF